MPRTPARFLLITAAAALALALTGCGSSSSGSDAGDGTTTTKADAKTTTTADPDTSTTEGEFVIAPEDEAICAQFQKISEFDQESTEVTRAGNWDDTQAYFVDETAGVLEAYDAAIALDSELSGDLQKLRDVSAKTAELAADATSLTDLSDQVKALPGITAAGEAGYRLSTYAEETCGTSTGSNAG